MKLTIVGCSGTIPGPEFRLNVGDRVIVHFENHLNAGGTGIHWHGIELPNANRQSVALSELVGSQVICALGSSQGGEDAVVLTVHLHDAGLVLIRPDREVEDGSPVA